MIEIHSKRDVFTHWHKEKTRFYLLFNSLTEKEAHEKCLTSTCGHQFREHIHCMVVWMKAAVKYFTAALEGNDVDIRPMDVSMLKWTNLEIDKIRDLPILQVWDNLDIYDGKLQNIIQKMGADQIFTEHNHRWTWLTWTTFGHYDVHSTELEFQRRGKIQTGLEKQWIFN